MKRSALACLLLATIAVFSFLDCREARKCNPKKIGCSSKKVMKKNKNCHSMKKNRTVGRRCKGKEKSRKNIRMNRYIAIKNKC